MLGSCASELGGTSESNNDNFKQGIGMGPDTMLALLFVSWLWVGTTGRHRGRELVNES